MQQSTVALALPRRGHRSFRAFARVVLVVLLAPLALGSARGAEPARPDRGAAAASHAEAGLACGRYTFPTCQGDASQFAPNFKPRTGYGGFGGQAGCVPRRTPVVFIHGNADSALGWSVPVSTLPGHPAPEHSVYDSFRAAGYQPCELYGVTYLSRDEQAHPARNFHRPEKYRILSRFLAAVRSATGAQRLDIVAHSLGVTMAAAALDHESTEVRPRGPGWQGVRRFVNLAGGLRGLSACRLVGPGNPLAPTCGSERFGNPWIFGFFPDNGLPLAGANRWTATQGPQALREAPQRHPDIAFYTLHAGRHDQVHCGTAQADDCAQGALFEPAGNVRAQLDLGAGSTTHATDFDFTDHSAFVSAGGDADGVGHFKVRNQSGAILVRMLGSECRALDCAAGYRSGPVRASP